MITRISIENFKGIGDQTVVVPIRPITLLFGPNSAGKSTIMHAVHYAREILERHNLDADRTVAGGDCVNLGGFREFVHRKDKARQIKLRLDLDLSGVAWHEAFPVDEFLHEYRVGTASDDLSTLGLDVMSGWVELVVGFDEPERATQPVVLKYSVGLDEQHLASLVYVPYERTSDGIDRGALLTDLNLYHPVLAWPEPEEESLGPVDFYFPQFRSFPEAVYFGDDVETVVDDELRQLAAGEMPENDIVSILKPPNEFEPGSIRRAQVERDDVSLAVWVGRCMQTGRLELCAASSTPVPGVESIDTERIIGYVMSWVQEQSIDALVVGLQDALPMLDRPIQLELEEPPYDYDDEESSGSSSGSYSESESPALEFLEQLLSRLIVGPGRSLYEYLVRFRYVGPIRDVPPPEHVPPRYPAPSRWASGLAAWDLLAEAESETLVEDVSNWLWADDRLNTGYQLVAKQVREIEQYLQDRMLRVEWEEGQPSDLVEDILAELAALPERQRVYVRDMERAVDLSACSVGLGISQVVPIIVAVLADHAAVVQLEQPALHLHPTQQAVIGDLLIQGALAKPGKTLLIETHSEHLILRILRRIRQTHHKSPFKSIGVRPEDVIALYVEPRNGQTNVFEIAIGEDGEFLQPWPDKFFDQDYEERFG